MRRETFKLPSGATIELRGMQVKDEDAITSSRGGRFSKVLNQLLDACCEGVVEAGPYGGLSSQPDWREMLQGDRYAALIKLRAISYRDGEQYEFDAQCARCGRPVEWTVDLLNDLREQPLPEGSVEHVQTGTPFETTLGGKTVRFRLGRGKDEEEFEKWQAREPKRLSSVALRVRIVDVEGVEKREILDWLSSLSTDDAEDLRDAFDEVDCGIDNEVEIECQNCGALFEVTLPFDQTFFLPGRGRRRRKKERKLGAA